MGVGGRKGDLVTSLRPSNGPVNREILKKKRHGTSNISTAKTTAGEQAKDDNLESNSEVCLFEHPLTKSRYKEYVQ